MLFKSFKMFSFFLSNKKCRLKHVANKLMSCLINEFLWILIKNWQEWISNSIESMELHNISWNSIDTPGNSMEFHGITWNYMAFHGTPWIPHGIPWMLHRTPWHSMELHEYSMDTPCNSLELHESSMEFHGGISRGLLPNRDTEESRLSSNFSPLGSGDHIYDKSCMNRAKSIYHI